MADSGCLTCLDFEALTTPGVLRTTGVVHFFDSFLRFDVYTIFSALYTASLLTLAKFLGVHTPSPVGLASVCEK